MVGKTQPPPPGSEMSTFKTCNRCLGKFPLPYYTFNKIGVYGRNNTCSECRAQAARIDRKVKYGCKPRTEEIFIREVKAHNEQTLDLALSIPNFTCYGFVPHKESVYKVHFGKSRYDLPSMAIFLQDGSIYKEFAYAGGVLEVSKKQVLEILKIEGIRLELTEADMIASKTTIYFL